MLLVQGNGGTQMELKLTARGVADAPNCCGPEDLPNHAATQQPRVKLAVPAMPEVKGARRWSRT